MLAITPGPYSKQPMRRATPFIAFIGCGALAMLIIGAIRLSDSGVNSLSEEGAIACTTLGTILVIISALSLYYLEKKKKVKNESIELRVIQVGDERHIIKIQRWFRRFYNRQNIYNNYKVQENNFKAKALTTVHAHRPETLRIIGLTLRAWGKEYNSNQETLQKLYSQKRIQKIKAEIDVCESGVRVASDAADCLEYRIDFVMDDDETIQAISVSEKDDGRAAWLIKELITAPHNMRSEFLKMDDSLRVEGSASALIENAIFLSYHSPREGNKLSSQNRTAVTAIPYTSALPVYQKWHFKPDLEGDRGQMILRGPDLHAFLREYGGRTQISPIK